MAVLECGPAGSTAQEVIAQINDNTAGVEVLEVDLSKHTFVFDQREDTLDIPETPTTVALVDIANAPAGNYLVGCSATYQSGSAGKSISVIMTVNGGTPNYYSREVKDITDREPFDYSFPYVLAVDGPFTLLLEMNKEDAGDNALDCLFSNAWVNWKSDL